MGVTYRAWDLRAGGPVVLKMPKRLRGDADGSEFERIAARFVREIETMRALSHDYIVPILDDGDDDGMPFVVMRFLPGGSLADHRKKNAAGDYQPSPASLLHNWLPSIADALDFIHAQGVLHRDIKPANIFFDGFGNPCLGDFGIAKVVDEVAGLEKGVTLTATHLAIGTPEYMAPELLSPKTVADGRADQYALAICVYELLAGRRPFTGAKTHIIIEHATLPVPPLDRQSLELPATMVAAVERALSKKPDDRFKSCHEFARAVLADASMQPYEPDVVRLLCPGCHKVLKVPRRAGGGRGNCPSCREFVEIASDFSALWLKSEAVLLAEPSESTPTPTPFGTSRLLGELDTDSEVANGVGATERAAPKAAGRVFGIGSVIGAALLFGLLGGALGLATTHLRWAGHHSAVVQQLIANRKSDQAAHVAAIQAAETAQRDAVAAVEMAWKKKLTEAERSWDAQFAEAVAAHKENEIKQATAQPTPPKSDEPMAALKEEKAELFEVKTDEMTEQDRSSRTNLATSLTNSIGIKFKLVSAGTFMMGEADGRSNDKPHDVTLTKPFYMGVYEVTNIQWKEVMGDFPDDWMEDDGNHELTKTAGRKGGVARLRPTFSPVKQVTWEDAVEFCRKLSAMPEERKAGRVYRLPTEAEWEYACRAGTTTKYSFGDDESQLGEYGWFDENSGGQVHPVGQKKPNALGLYDMHGNVWELCSDWYGDYADNAVVDPQGPLSGSFRVWRGGCWRGNARYCRSAGRVRVAPSVPYDPLGFRLALSPSGAEPSEATENTQQKPSGSKAEPATGGAEVVAEPVELPSLTNSIGIKFNLVSAGTFLMGDADGRSNDKLHDVTLTKPFYMGVYEVTNGEWKQVMGKVPSQWKEDDRPVEQVSLADTAMFCQKLSAMPEERKAGRVYRLPTEAEWEYACRAGTKTAYSFGGDKSLLGDFAWFRDNSDSSTHPVGQKKPNPWGLYDMHGNVWEWCSDWYGDYAGGGATDPRGPPAGSDRVARGGGWRNPDWYCRSADRLSNYPLRRINFLGFRLALSPSGAEPSDATENTQQKPAGSKAEPATGGAEVVAEPVELPSLTNSIGIKFKLVPAGTFMMGESKDEQHEVKLTKPFYMGVYEVMNIQWKQVMGSVPSKWKEDERPVDSVKWDDAVEFCRKLSAMPEERKAGRVYRLPTEAEWEYACRAGTKTKYSFGDDESRLGEYCWFDGNSGEQTHPVGQKKANAWGLFDIHGNVEEWCSDWHGPYARGQVTDTAGPPQGSFRTYRGGAWRWTSTDCRSARRRRRVPSYNGDDMGFRLALSPVGNDLPP